MRKIRILHITRDDKFFDSVFAQFELEQRFNNKAVLEVKNKLQYNYRRIRNIEKVNLLTKEEMRSVLIKGEYDVLYFYSMPRKYYDYFKWIPDNKIVIWWGWGVELYKSICGLKPLIPIVLYKPLTSNVLNEISESSFTVIKARIGYWLLRPWSRMLQEKMLKRIDYFQPVLSQESLLMKKLDGFHAKEFFTPNTFSYVISDPLISKKENGNILFGNSQAPTNNHLDVWHDIREFLPEKRKVIIPVNYLGDKKYAKLIRERIISDKNELIFLQDFMAPKDYFALMDTCSYAVFGILRQQAIGNIYGCLVKGIKVFLYRDSLVYRFLKEDGFAVFAIEDIDKSSFSTPLTITEIEQNRDAFLQKRQYINAVYENAIEEIFNRI